MIDLILRHYQAILRGILAGMAISLVISIYSGHWLVSMFTLINIAWVAVFLFSARQMDRLHRQLALSEEHNKNLDNLLGQMIVVLKETSNKLVTASGGSGAQISVVMHPMESQAPKPEAPQPPTGPNIIELKRRKPADNGIYTEDGFSAAMLAISQPDWPGVSSNPHAGYEHEAPKPHGSTEGVAFSTGGTIDTTGFHTGGTMEGGSIDSSSSSSSDSSSSSSSSGGSND